MQISEFTKENEKKTVKHPKAKSKFMLNTPKLSLKSLHSKAFVNSLSKHSVNAKTLQSYNIHYLIFNENTSIVSQFKDYLIYDEDSEFLKKFYSNDYLQKKLNLIIGCYQSEYVYKPNYYPLYYTYRILMNDYVRQKEKLLLKQRSHTTRPDQENYDLFFNSDAKDILLTRSYSTSIYDIIEDLDREFIKSKYPTNNENGHDFQIKCMKSLNRGVLDSIQRESKSIISYKTESFADNYEGLNIQSTTIDNKCLDYQKNINRLNIAELLNNNKENINSNENKNIEPTYEKNCNEKLENKNRDSKVTVSRSNNNKNFETIVKKNQICKTIQSKFNNLKSDAKDKLGKKLSNSNKLLIENKFKDYCLKQKFYTIGDKEITSKKNAHKIKLNHETNKILPFKESNNKKEYFTSINNNGENNNSKSRLLFKISTNINSIPSKSTSINIFNNIKIVDSNNEPQNKIFNYYTLNCQCNNNNKSLSNQQEHKNKDNCGIIDEYSQKNKRTPVNVKIYKEMKNSNLNYISSDHILANHNIKMILNNNKASKKKASSLVKNNAINKSNNPGNNNKGLKNPSIKKFKQYNYLPNKNINLQHKNSKNKNLNLKNLFFNSKSRGSSNEGAKNESFHKSSIMYKSKSNLIKSQIKDNNRKPMCNLKSRSKNLRGTLSIQKKQQLNKLRNDSLNPIVCSINQRRSNTNENNNSSINDRSRCLFNTSSVNQNLRFNNSKIKNNSKKNNKFCLIKEIKLDCASRLRNSEYLKTITSHIDREPTIKIRSEHSKSNNFNNEKNSLSLKNLQDFKSMGIEQFKAIVFDKKKKKLR